jgi:hypothetical protein
MKNRGLKNSCQISTLDKIDEMRLGFESGAPNPSLVRAQKTAPHSLWVGH